MIQHEVSFPSCSRKPGKDYLREFIIVLFHINAVGPNLGLKLVKKEDTSSQSPTKRIDFPEHPPVNPHHLHTCHLPSQQPQGHTSHLSGLSIHPQHLKTQCTHILLNPKPVSITSREPVLGLLLLLHTRQGMP